MTAPTLEAIAPAPAPLRLGTLPLEGRVALAPMAGYTDTEFRRLARRSGAAFVVTEMVSSRAYVANAENEKTLRLMDFTEEERPVGIQLFGADPEIMGEAAARILEEKKPDFLDVNFGCPVGKILKCDAGAAVLKEPKRAGRIVAAMVRATGGRVPVTVKTRAGFDTMDSAVDELLESVEEAGAAALAVHARTRSQMFEGKADWSVLARLKRRARIPVFGNGDVRGPEDAKRLFEETGCDGILVARASMGAPWVFAQIRRALEDGVILPPPPLADRLEAALEQLRGALERKGPRLGLLEMRKHLTHYLKGFEGARAARQELLTCEDPFFVTAGLEDLVRRAREGALRPVAD